MLGSKRNVSTAKELVANLRTQDRQRVHRKDRIRSAALTSFLWQIACALQPSRFCANAAAASTPQGFAVFVVRSINHSATLELKCAAETSHCTMRQQSLS
jgi:hypothetical protein